MDKLEHAINQIKKHFDFDEQTELNYDTNFQLLVSVMLSAQSTDIQVNKATSKLFKKIKQPEDIISMWQAKLKESLNSINYYKNKSKYIYKTAQMLIDDFDSKVPSSFEDLISLMGVWEKTAKVVLIEIFDNTDRIPVDTHVHRVANRLGIVHTSSPSETSKQLEKLISKSSNSASIHHQLLLFGRYHCKAQNPKCKWCPLRKGCEYV